MVNVGYEIATMLPYLRAQAESRFTEVWDVFTVENVLDESTGLETPTEVVAYTDVRGRVRYPTLTVSERQQGSQVPAVQDVTISVAVGATPDVVVNHQWRCTASTADASLIGRTFRTKGEAQAGQVTAARYPVERVS
jgi:hypothetical protein